MEIENAHLAFSNKRNLPVVYESGMHVFPIVWEGSNITEAFLQGNLSVHQWNPEISRRIRRYSPYILGLDSAAAVFGSDGKGIYWPWLPGNPKDLNGRDSIYVVAGDLLHWQMVSNDTQNKDPMIDDMRAAGWNKVIDYGVKAGTEFLSTAALGIASLTALLRSRREESRRAFLKSCLGVVGGLALGVTVGRAAPLMHSFSEDPGLSGIHQAITEATKFRLARSGWLDGRTALVIAKTVDAMDLMEIEIPTEGVGSIVMGWPHSYEAGPLLKSREKRAHTIREYALELEKDVFPIAQKVGFVEDTPDGRLFVREVTLSILIQTDIYQVKDPGVEKTDNLYETLLQSIKWLGRFRSPEVLEALRPLGDPEKWAN